MQQILWYLKTRWKAASSCVAGDSFRDHRYPLTNDLKNDALKKEARRYLPC
jgi:hypothetical protein